MPLQFDARAFLAPGGVASGLDDLGSAVVNALNRRSERKYQTEAEARRRTQQLADLESGRGYQTIERVAGEGARERAAETARAGVLALQNDVQSNDATKRIRDTVVASADAWDPTSADPYADLEQAAAAKIITPAELGVLRTRRMAAKSKHEADAQTRDARDRPQRTQIPKAETWRDTTKPDSVPQLDTAANIANLEAAATNAAALGNTEQAATLRALAARQKAVEALGQPPEDDTMARMKNIPFGDLWASKEYQDIGVPRPTRDKAYNSADVFAYDPATGTIDFRERDAGVIDDADEQYLEDDSTRIGRVQAANKQFRARREGEMKAEFQAKLAAHRAKVSAAQAGEALGGAPTGKQYSRADEADIAVLMNAGDTRDKAITRLGLAP
jgi:hypothetical protein